MILFQVNLCLIRYILPACYVHIWGTGAVEIQAFDIVPRGPSRCAAVVPEDPEPRLAVSWVDFGFLSTENVFFFFVALHIDLPMKTRGKWRFANETWGNLEISSRKIWDLYGIYGQFMEVRKGSDQGISRDIFAPNMSWTASLGFRGGHEHQP